MASPAAVTVTRKKAVVPTTPLTGVFDVAGTYSHPVAPGPNPDTGSHYTFTGAGRKRSLGRFTLSGDLMGPGFIAQGQYRGYITLTGSAGSITVRLLGPLQAPGPLPSTFFYKIVNGTGAYAHSIGKGTVSLSASDTTHRFVFRFNPTT